MKIKPITLAILIAGAAFGSEAVTQGMPRQAIGTVPLPGPVASLFVLNARGATLADGKLTLTGVSPSSIAFADRPVRAAGHIETAQFIERWNQGEDQARIDPPNATISVLAGTNVADAVVTISAPALEGETLTFDAVVLEGTLEGATGPAALFIDRGGFGGFHGGGGMMAGGGFHGGGDFRGGGFGGPDHFSNYAHAENPHAAWYRSDDSGPRNYDPHNTYNYGGGYGGGWGAGAAGLAAGAAIGAAAENGGYGYPYPPYPYCGYPPYPPCN